MTTHRKKKTHAKTHSVPSSRSPHPREPAPSRGRFIAHKTVESVRTRTGRRMRRPVRQNLKLVERTRADGIVQHYWITPHRAEKMRSITGKYVQKPEPLQSFQGKPTLEKTEIFPLKSRPGQYRRSMRVKVDREYKSLNKTLLGRQLETIYSPQEPYGGRFGYMIFHYRVFTKEGEREGTLVTRSFQNVPEMRERMRKEGMYEMHKKQRKYVSKLFLDTIEFVSEDRR